MKKNTLFYRPVLTLNTHMVHINLSMIFYTCVEHSPTKTVYLKYYTEYYTYKVLYSSLYNADNIWFVSERIPVSKFLTEQER